MQKTFFSVLFAFAVLGFVLAPEVYSQNVTIELGTNVVVIPKEDAKKVKEISKTKPPVARIKAGGDSEANRRAQEDKAALSLQDVEALAKQFRLTERTDKNPQLAFNDAEISDWYRRKLKRPDLMLEFAARRTILDAADRQNVSIRDQEMLSQAARELIRIANEEDNVSVRGGAQVKQERPPDVSGLICEGDTSEELIRQAWEALNAGKGALGAKELEKALACTKVAIDTWADKADEQQAKRLQAGECKVTPEAQDKDSYSSSYWALSDVSAAWFIRGQVFGLQRKWADSREAYKVDVDRYPCAYVWDPRGWFWRTAEGAEREIKKLP